MIFTRDQFESSARLVYRYMPATPQFVWPQICELAGTTVWVKHENHTPTGAFKVRGGITFIDWLKRTHPSVGGIIMATRGNHGQSLARAASAVGLKAKILVPLGNAIEKNAAMRAYGGEVVEYGNDFDEARQQAMRLAKEEGLWMVPPYHPELVRGVASYAFELFTAVPDLDFVYVPIGCGSGVCATIAVRDALGLKTKIVGVVSEAAQSAKLSVEAGRLIDTDSARTFADGMAVRVPVEEAFEYYSKRLEKVAAVSDPEVAEAMRIYFRMTHNVAEGAGAASLAAVMQDREALRGKNVGVILSGGNVDSSVFQVVLTGETPAP